MFLKRDILFDIPQNDTSSLQIQGKGAKNLVVICSTSDFNEEAKLLLKNIMKAVSHDFVEDIFVVTVNNGSKILLNELGFHYRNAVIFGLKPQEIGINIEHVQNHLLRLDDFQFIFSQSLKEVGTNQTYKTALWKNLQSMFAS